MQALKILLVLVLTLGSVEHSECVRCFAEFDKTSGKCSKELGEVDEEDDCCQNPNYGYQKIDGPCQSCGPPVWSPWSSWSLCNELCGEGVRQRSRKCFGIGQSECENTNYKLETEACNSTCCDGKGWDPWLSWSPCSVTCGGVGGVRKRQRVCTSLPECRLACSGSSVETENCAINSTCPVDGGWSPWSSWSHCSGSCIDDQREGSPIPSRMRHRSCSNPTPSDHTVPPGNGCSGEGLQVQDCSELPNCPVDGSWGTWAPSGPCSVTCGEGLQLSIRKCDSPTPKYGGRLCDGPSTQSSVCQSPCPVHGLWSGWSSWSECSATCIAQGGDSIKVRQRSCSNPAPSSIPPGDSCQGDDSQLMQCNHMPHCPVDGGWGSWSPFGPCSVTCGVGVQVSVRSCDSPATKHGGRPCVGEGSQTRLCYTNRHCPVDGMWSEWTKWSACEYPFGNRDIRCKQTRGKQTREHWCLHQAHNGTICPGESLTDKRTCYDVNRCPIKGTWGGWESWSLCTPPCGKGSKRSRKRICNLDYSSYRDHDIIEFFGRPLADCGAPPDGIKSEQALCMNVPDCS
ncbi:properdin-like [Parambassis ranga]|uniref:Properdin-like n=1 Tax=Parambassis ranga TaxID=210632 RepID=A0A6P7IXD7_9TELE|nr:properdin [Parambassis ranga]